MLRTFFFNIIYITLYFNLFKLCVFETPVQVNLEQGVLLGKIDKTFFKEQNFYTFKGVPYGKPPIGEYRFKVRNTINK